MLNRVSGLSRWISMELVYVEDLQEHRLDIPHQPTKPHKTVKEVAKFRLAYYFLNVHYRSHRIFNTEFLLDTFP